MLRRTVALILATIAVAPAARAADPVMPLAEVRPGMSCIGLSVVRGTAISEFNVEVIDVLAAEPGAGGPRILVRVSGPAVDATGIGPGFSGSPILCNDSSGTRRNIGAISEGLGEYGNHVVLATPIEEVLTGRPASTARARHYPDLVRSARPLADPLTVSGASRRTRELLGRALRRGGGALLAAPAGPQGGYPPQELVPGAAVAAAVSTGDVALGAIGTVAYRDGASVWAFGHELDGIGRRSLFLQDSYVFGVIGNPLGLAEAGAGTYKLASARGHVQGSLTNDTFASVAGTVGSEPPYIPLRVVAREDSGAIVALDSRLADERSLGYGAGLGLVAPLGVSETLDRLLRSFEPITFSMCGRFHIRERRRPIGFCNRYFDLFSALDDLTQAASLMDSYDLTPLHIERARVSLRARRGVTSEVLAGASAPRTVRRGERIRVRVRVQRRRAGRRTLTLRLRIPRDLKSGSQSLVLSGNSLEQAFEDEFVLLLAELVVGEGLTGGSEARSVDELARRVSGLRRPLGIEARFRRREGQVVYRSDDVAFEGRVRVNLQVRRARR